MSEPQDWHNFLQGIGIACGGGLVGRLMHHVGRVSRGQRRAFSLALVWEVPTALGMGLIGQGAADWLSLDPMPALAVVTTLSYLGPRVLEEVFGIVKRRIRGNEDGIP